MISFVNKPPDPAQPLFDLTGIRIWLSASVPDEASPAEKDRLLNFVKRLAGEVFRNNGQLIHGSHPSIVPALLQEAARFRDSAQRKPQLTLMVSRWFSKDPNANGIDRAAWQELADVRETPDPGFGTTRVKPEIPKKCSSGLAGIC